MYVIFACKEVDVSLQRFYPMRQSHSFSSSYYHEIAYLLPLFLLLLFFFPQNLKPIYKPLEASCFGGKAFLDISTNNMMSAMTDTSHQ